MKTITVIAGPNGSGKTSLVECMSDKDIIDRYWINPDEIARKLGDWNSETHILEAARKADKIREVLLRNNKTFTFETFLSAQNKVDFIKRAKELNYRIKVYFVCTESPSLNAKRVAERYLKGGHSVPVDKIVDRYFKSLANFRQVIDIADVVQIFDNTQDDVHPTHVLTYVDGNIYKVRADIIPKWCQNTIPDKLDNEKCWDSNGSRG